MKDPQPERKGEDKPLFYMGKWRTLDVASGKVQLGSRWLHLHELDKWEDSEHA